MLTLKYSKSLLNVVKYQSGGEPYGNDSVSDSEGGYSFGLFYDTWLILLIYFPSLNMLLKMVGCELKSFEFILYPISGC